MADRKAIADAIKSLKKALPDAFGLDTDLVPLSTGCIAVDIITGIGGFPRGRVSEVFGKEASGKTTLCLTACANAQREGLYAVYLDAERGVDLHYASKIGFVYDDENVGQYLTPTTFEETGQMIQHFAEAGADIIVVDSVPGLVPESRLKGDITDSGAIGEIARLLSIMLSRLTKIIHEKQVAFVMVNQMRSVVAQGPFSYGPKETSAGGNALKYYSSLRLNTRKVRESSEKRKTVDIFTGKDVEVPIASTHGCEAMKNKVGVPYREATFTIRFDEVSDSYGIDNVQTIVDMACALRVVEQRASFFAYKPVDGEEWKVQGAAALYARVKGDPALQQELVARTKELL